MLRNTLTSFCRLMGPILPASLIEAHIEAFIRMRREEETAPATINKDLRGLKSFTRFCVWKELMPRRVLNIHWLVYWQTQEHHKHRTLSVQEFSSLLRAARDLYGMGWVMRIVLAVTTGLRQQDIERLTVSDINTETGTLAAENRKAHKFDSGRPLNNVAVVLLRRYIAKLPAGQTSLWSDKYHASKFARIKRAAGLTDMKFHSLRASCASFVMNAGFSTGVAQDLLEHSTPILTHQVYADLSPVHRDAVNSIPLAAAIDGLGLDDE
jgi:integrase